MKTIFIVTILLIFFGTSEAQEAISKILGAGETADLTQEQLRDCILLQKKLNKQANIIELANSELKLLKEEIDKRASYLEEKRSKNLTNQQIKNFNNTITKQKQAISTYNKKIDSSKDKFTSYQTDKKSFNMDCADKSYNADDMKVVTAELEEEADKVKTSQYSLTINPTPANAEVKIMNIVPKYKHGILLKPGKYDIYVTHADYSEYREWIEIKDSDVDIDVILQKK